MYVCLIIMLLYDSLTGGKAAKNHHNNAGIVRGILTITIVLALTTAVGEEALVVEGVVLGLLTSDCSMISDMMFGTSCGSGDFTKLSSVGAPESSTGLQV